MHSLRLGDTLRLKFMPMQPKPSAVTVMAALPLPSVRLPLMFICPLLLALLRPLASVSCGITEEAARKAAPISADFCKNVLLLISCGCFSLLSVFSAIKFPPVIFYCIAIQKPFGTGRFLRALTAAAPGFLIPFYYRQMHKSNTYLL